MAGRWVQVQSVGGAGDMCRCGGRCVGQGSLYHGFSRDCMSAHRAVGLTVLLGILASRVVAA